MSTHTCTNKYTHTHRLERELKGREEVINDSFVSISALRRRVMELEKHKFVLAYKVCVPVCACVCVFVCVCACV